MTLEPPLPTLPSKIGHGIGSIIKNMTSVANGNPLTVPDYVARHRGIICQNCIYYRKSDEKCGICGCTTWRKARLTAEACPKGHWDKHNHIIEPIVPKLS